MTLIRDYKSAYKADIQRGINYKKHSTFLYTRPCDNTRFHFLNWMVLYKLIVRLLVLMASVNAIAAANLKINEIDGKVFLTVSASEITIPILSCTNPYLSCNQSDWGLVISYWLYQDPTDPRSGLNNLYQYCSGKLPGETCPANELGIYFDRYFDYSRIRTEGYKYLEIQIYPAGAGIWWYEDPYVILKQTFSIVLGGNGEINQLKTQGPPDPTACIGNPINAGTANKYQLEADYAGRGAFPLAFNRHYNSQNGAVGVLGANWTAFAKLTDLTATSLKAQRPDGRTYTFTASNGQWLGDADVTDRLEPLADGGWRYTAADDSVETFDANGKLQQVSNRQGLSQTYAYNADGQLTSVSDAFGRSLGFSYDAQSRLAGMTDPAGGQYAYAYDAGGNLVSVTYPDGRSRTYHYEDSRFPRLLTGITDENGDRYATWGYDAQGRAMLSEHAGGADHTQIAYNADGSTSVTDALGTVRTYRFKTVLGMVKGAGLDQPAGAGCGPAASQIDYDANGNVAARTDFNGSKTTYAYDVARNLETRRTEAAGTAQARTTVTTWHPSLRLPSQVTVYAGESATGTPLLTTDYSYDGQGNLLGKTEQGGGASRSQVFSYNAAGQVSSADGPRADVADITAYGYDAQGNLASITNALGQTTRLAGYNAHGLPTQVTDANGVTTTLAYDSRQRLTSRDTAGETTQYRYNGVGQLIGVTLPDGTSLSYSYDAAHRLTQIQDSAGNRIAYSLDALGNRIGEDSFDPTGQLARHIDRVYDALGRLQAITGTAAE